MYIAKEGRKGRRGGEERGKGGEGIEKKGRGGEERSNWKIT